MKFIINPKIFSDFPGVLIGVIVATNLDNQTQSKKVEKLLKEQEKIEHQKLKSVKAIARLPEISSRQTAFKKFAVTPKEACSSLGALLRRAKAKKPLPTINPVVDICNYISLKYHLPVGIKDLDSIKGDLHLTYANGTETGVFLNDSKPSTALKGEVLYKDHKGIVCGKWNYQQAERTKITKKTKNAIIILEAFPPVNKNILKKALDELSQILQNETKSKTKLTILSKSQTALLLESQKKQKTSFKSSKTRKTKITQKKSFGTKRAGDNPLKINQLYKSDTNTIKCQIQQKIANTINSLYPELKLQSTDIHLEHPAVFDHGDYATNISLTISSKISQKPIEIANKIKEALQHSKPDFLHKIEVKPPGFINLFLSPAFFSRQINKLLTEKENYGRNSELKKTTIMVEFAHPNTHKQFHIGHFRNITTGEAIVRILQACQAKVIRANYQGDVGLHIAKTIYALKLKIKDKKLKIKNYQNKPIKEKIKLLAHAYSQGHQAYIKDPKAKKEIEKINIQIYQNDPKIKNLYQTTRLWSLKYFDQIYKRVYSHFDRFYFESEVSSLGKKIVLENTPKIFKKSNQAIIFPGENYGLHNRVFITKAGLPTYEGKDIGLAKLQFEKYHPQLIIHVVGPEQISYFKVVFEAIYQVFPSTRNRQYHLVYGWVRLKKGKMSSRRGAVVTANWLLDEIKTRLKKILKPEKTTGKQFANILEAAAVAAAKYSFLKVSPPTEIAFDINQSINLAGNSGPYLQYTYARCQSVLKKAEKNIPPKSLLPENLKKEELLILRTFYKYPEIVKEAATNLSPNIIADFLYDLSQKYNTFYNLHPILNSEKKSRTFRLSLTIITSQILKNGLYLLGIKPLEKM